MNALVALQMMDTTRQNAEDTACRGKLCEHMVGYYNGILDTYALIAGTAAGFERAANLRAEIRDLAAAVKA
jgi:hypothetical protein